MSLTDAERAEWQEIVGRARRALLAGQPWGPTEAVPLAVLLAVDEELRALRGKVAEWENRSRWAESQYDRQMHRVDAQRKLTGWARLPEAVSRSSKYHFWTVGKTQSLCRTWLWETSAGPAESDLIYLPGSDPRRCKTCERLYDKLLGVGASSPVREAH